jgi:hypothetical protein
MNETVKETLDLIISGEIKEADVKPPIAPSKVTDYLKELGYEEDLDFNGWQWDYWIYYRQKGCKTLVLCGSGYYGGQVFMEEE